MGLSRKLLLAKGEKSMKRMLAVVLLVVLCIMPVSGSAPGFGGLFVNGESVYTPVRPVEENGRTLVPVRAVAEELDYEVEWDGDTNSVTVSDGQDVLKLTIDSLIYEWNGEPKTLDVPPRLIQDRTFVPVRLIAESFGYRVDWDEKSGVVSIKTPPIEDEAIDLDLLVKYGIISKEDLKKDRYITTLEALTAINQVINDGEIITDLEYWYEGDTLAPLDNLDDVTKGLLLSLRGYWSGRGILKDQELLMLELEKNLTHYKALVYITRMVGSTYSCTDSPIELDFTEMEQTYQAAFRKGLISETDMTQAEEVITREAFYKLLYKALFVKYKVGGYGGVSTGSYINELVRRATATPRPTATPKPQPKEISIETTIHDDLSITWSIPEEYKEYSMEVSLVFENGETKLGRTSTVALKMFTSEEILKYLVTTKHNNPQYIHCIYNGETESVYFDIDITNIKVQTEGESVKPGVYTNFEHQWTPKYITLADGREFKKDAWYLLTSYQHKYRKQEYNWTERMLFRVKEDTERFSKETSGITNGSIGLDDMHIQEITVSGNAAEGFVIHITPESPETFTITEEPYE